MPTITITIVYWDPISNSPYFSLQIETVFSFYYAKDNKNGYILDI